MVRFGWLPTVLVIAMAGARGGWGGAAALAADKPHIVVIAADGLGNADLGHAHAKYWPQHRGFDHFYGNVVGEVDCFTKERGGV